MSLSKVLERGLSRAMEEGAQDLRANLAERNLPKGLFEECQEAALAMPSALEAINALTYDAKAPMALRALFPAVMSYLFSEENLVKSEGKQLLLGLLDDAYLVHLTVRQVLSSLPASHAEPNRRHLAALSRALPEGVAKALEKTVADAAEQSAREARRYGG